MEEKNIIFGGKFVLVACAACLSQQLECIEHISKAKSVDKCMREAMCMFANHVTNMFTCGMIPEEMFRDMLGEFITDEAIEQTVKRVKKYQANVLGAEEKFSENS